MARNQGVAVNAGELRRRRQATGLPAMKFAPLVGLSHQHLSNLETGAMPRTSPEALARLARQLECEPADLLAETAA